MMKKKKYIHPDPLKCITITAKSGAEALEKEAKIDKLSNCWVSIHRYIWDDAPFTADSEPFKISYCFYKEKPQAHYCYTGTLEIRWLD